MDGQTQVCENVRNVLSTVFRNNMLEKKTIKQNWNAAVEVRAG
jgi:hypothetical protein